MSNIGGYISGLFSGGYGGQSEAEDNPVPRPPDAPETGPFYNFAAVTPVPPPAPPPAETPEEEKARTSSPRRGRASTILTALSSYPEDDERRFSARRYLGANDPGRG